MWEKAFKVEYTCGGNDKNYGYRGPKLEKDLEW